MATGEIEDSIPNFALGNKISIVKLNDDDFLIWKLHISTTLEGYELNTLLYEIKLNENFRS